MLSGSSVFSSDQVVLVIKNLLTNAGDVKDDRFNPWVRRAPRETQLTPVLSKNSMDRGA